MTELGHYWNNLWKILKQMGIPDHFTCLLRNWQAIQEATARMGHVITDWFRIQKGVCQDRILSPFLFNLYAEYFMWNAGLDEAQAGIKIARRNIKNLKIGRWCYLYGRKQGGTKEALDEGERRDWESWLKTQHSEKWRSWHPVPSLHGKQMGKQWKQWQILFSWAPQSLWTVNVTMKLKDTCSVGKSYDKLSVLKSRDITLLTKVYIIKAMVSPEVMYGCERWIIKKAECQRTDAFELWCWRRLLKVP